MTLQAQRKPKLKTMQSVRSAFEHGTSGYWLADAVVSAHIKHPAHQGLGYAVKYISKETGQSIDDILAEISRHAKGA